MTEPLLNSMAHPDEEAGGGGRSLGTAASSFNVEAAGGPAAVIPDDGEMMMGPGGRIRNGRQGPASHPSASSSSTSSSSPGGQTWPLYLGGVVIIGMMLAMTVSVVHIASTSQALLTQAQAQNNKTATASAADEATAAAAAAAAEEAASAADKGGGGGIPAGLEIANSFFSVVHGAFAATPGAPKSAVVLFMVPNAVLGTNFVLSHLIERGDGTGTTVTGMGLAGQMLGGVDRFKAFYFQVNEDRTKLLLYGRDSGTRDTGAPDDQLLAQGTSDVWLQSLPVMQDDGMNMVVDGSPWVTHAFGLLSMCAGCITRLVHVNGYPQNVNLLLEFTDGRSTTQIAVDLALLPAPADRMTSRTADPRIGYFTTAYTDVGLHYEDAASSVSAVGVGPTDVDRKVHLITRWRLEKDESSCDADRKCDPKKPLIYHVDPTIPTEWRAAVKRGIELWQPAFAALGFRNTPRARLPSDPDWPKDYNSGDMRYHSVSFGIGGAVQAVAGSVIDPYTGEILSADVGFAEEWVSALAGQIRTSELGLASGTAGTVNAHGRVFVGAAGATAGESRQQEQPPRLLRRRPDSHMGHSRRHGFGCNHARVAESAATNRLSAHMSLLVDSNGRVPKSVIEDGLAGITVHEIGHTLGLRHNFKGSAHTPHSQIYNKKYTIEHGASASVMDYVNPIVAPTAAEQSASLVFPGGHTIGAYDQLAIKYGYTEVQGEKSGWQHPIVAAIAKEMGSTGLMFGTDNDAALSEIEMDPLAKRYDMTGDPVRWQLDQLKIAQRLQEVDPKYATSDTFSSGFTVITGAIWQSLTLQVSAVDNAVDWLGGRIINHAFPGDRPSAEAGPVRPVSSAYQKGALGILTTFIGNPFYRYSAGFSNNAKAVATQDNLVAYGSGFGFQAPMPYGVRALNIRRTFDSCVEAAIGKVLDAKKLLRIHAVDIALTRAHPSATPWAPDDWPVDKGEGGVGVYAVLRAVSNAVWAQWNCQVISQPVEWPLISTFTEKICKLHDITTPGSEAAEAAAVGSLAQINVYAAAVREEMLQNVTDHLTSGSCSGAPVPVGAKEFVVSMQRMLNKTVS